jgi:uncharacterized protein (TIGR03437 family)
MTLLRFLLACAAPLALSAMPLHFEPNRGQAAPPALYVARGAGATRFTAAGADFGDGADRVSMRLEGARRGTPEALEPTSGRSNYLSGRRPEPPITGVPHFAKLLYGGVYRGVDLVFYGGPSGLEYDFAVAAGADARAIRMRFRGGSAALVGEDLVVRAGGRELRHHRPMVYQETAAGRRYVAARYRMTGQTVSFEIGDYDRSLPLTIDPVLSFASYLGGGDADVANAVALDSAGNVVVAGYAKSTDFGQTATLKGAATTSGQALFFAKLDPTGAHILWSTYVKGGANLTLAGAALDASDNIVFAASADAGGALTPTNGAYATANATGFAGKLPANGAQLTLVSAFAAIPAAVALDASGNIYVTGYADSAFQTTTGAAQTALSGIWDAFALKLSADGSKALYATFLGGSAEDWGNAIAVDSAGYVYLAGDTSSSDFPGTSGTKFGGREYWDPMNWYGDGFIARLDPTGARVVYGAYLGGAAPDSALAVTADKDGNAFVAGGTASADFSTTDKAYQAKFAGPDYEPAYPTIQGDAFVAKFSPTGSRLWSTLAGGTEFDWANAIALDSAGNVFVAGNAGPGFPKTANSIPKCLNVGEPFVAEFDSTGAQLLRSTGVGGLGLDYGFALALSKDGGAAYLAGAALSQAFFATPGAARKVYGGGDSDAYVAKIDLSATPKLAVACVLNGASFKAGNEMPANLGSVAPGEIVSIFGVGVGPDQPVSSPDLLPAGCQVSATNSCTVATTLGGVQVLFDGIPAPMLYVGSTQINAVVPYGVKAPATQMTVQRAGYSDGPWIMPVVDAVPAIFSANSSGMGQAAVINQDWTYNSPSHPAPPGSIITFYMTGAGALAPAMADGALALISTEQPKPKLPVSVTLRGQDAPDIQFAGAAPGYVSGLIQVNVKVPANQGFGNSVALVVKVGDFSSQSTLWIAVE